MWGSTEKSVYTLSSQYMARRPSPDEWSSETRITCEKARAPSSRLGPLAVFRENRTYKCPTIKEHFIFLKRTEMNSTISDYNNLI